MRLVPLLALLATAPALAQSPLVYTPDSLVAPFSEVVVTNPTPAPIQIDSLTARFGQETGGSIGGWSLEVEVDGVTRFVYLVVSSTGSFPSHTPQSVALTLAPGAAGTVRVIGYDPCPVCRSSGRVGRVDTLVVHTDAGTDRLRLDNAGIVASEAAPSGVGAVLSVHPNPAHGPSAVEVHLPESAREATVEVFDATGRRVAAVLDGPMPAGRTTARLDVGEWPAGVYLVRARIDGRTVVAPLTVVR